MTDVFTREQEQLAASPPPDTSPLVGTALDDAELLDPHGEPTTLGAALAGRAGVIVLYRGAWCPHCNLALRTYQSELLPELRRRDVALVAISPQRPDGSLTMREKQQLEFAVLSDPGNAIAARLGVLTGPSPEARAAQLAAGLDLEAVNADGTATLPMPTTVIIDADRTIRWIDVHPDYSTRTAPAEILDALTTASRTAPA